MLEINDDRIVTIARYDSPAMAHLGRALLEAAGIPALVAGENNPGLLLFHALVGKSVELQVFESHSEAALEALKSAPEPEAEAHPGPSAAEDPSLALESASRSRRGGGLFWLASIAVAALLMLSGFYAVGAAIMLLAQIVLLRKRSRMPTGAPSSAAQF